MNHVRSYFDEVMQIAIAINADEIERLACELDALRSRNGRLFCLGLGGSAANASHAASDFRKLCRIAAWCPSDNVAELTARANDEGFGTVFAEYLANCDVDERDGIFVFSVGGGTPTISYAISRAVQLAKEHGMSIYGIVGRDGGMTKRNGNCVIVVPEIKERVTPHTEAFQMVVLHCLVSHPILQLNATKW